MKKTAATIYSEFKRRLAGSLLVFIAIVLMIFFSLSFLAAFFAQKEQGATRTPEEVTVNIQFPHTPIKAGELTELIIRFSDGEGIPYTALRSSRGKYVHAYITNEDLILYGHDHPDDYTHDPRKDAASGMFRMPILFPEPGLYAIAFVFDTEHEKDVQKIFEVSVADESGNMVAGKSTPAPQDLRSTKNFDGYTVTLSTIPDILRACDPATLKYAVRKDDGATIRSFDPYDNAAAVIAAWDRSLRSFVPAWAQTTQNSSGEDVLHAETMFHEPGQYQVFSEFKHNGEVIASSFVVDIEDGECIE